MVTNRGSSRTRLWTVISMIIALSLLVLPGAATGAEAKTIKRVRPATFGIHSYSTDPQIPTGSLRLSCAPTWREVQPGPGVYRWQTMDRVINRAGTWGIKDVLFSFCGTPRWAGSTVKHPEREILGPGSTSAPRKMSYWRTYIKAVVRRYKGRIDSYQVWNEMTSPQFYQGSAKRMARMTKVVNRVVRKYDRKATVVSASVQTHRDDYYKRGGVRYLRALKRKSWPVEVLSGHFYPDGAGGPDVRMKQIAKFKRTLRRLHAPRSLPLWDTESNYWTSVPGNPAGGRVRGRKAAVFVARTYLDTWRTGLSRSYWYMWSNAYVTFVGVQMRPGDTSTKTYQTVADWTLRTRFRKCRTSGDLVVCKFKPRGKKTFKVAFTTEGKARVRFKGTKTVCPASGAACKQRTRRVKVRALPLKIG